MKRIFLPGLLFAFTSVIVLVSCSKIDDHYTRNGQVFYGVTSGNEIIKYNAKNPDRVLQTLSVSGIESGDQLMAIDFRPATGQLFAMSRNSRLYIIDVQTGATSGPIGDDAFSPEVYGTFVGFDFDPVMDRIRLVTDLGQNLLIDPATGATAKVDAPLNPGTPFVVGSAYTNSKKGARSTELYGLDLSTQKLVKQGNDGKMTSIGSLKAGASGEAGFDISSDNQVVLACMNVPGNSKSMVNTLFYVDLKTGEATAIGELARPIIGLAIPTQQSGSNTRW
jgi:hypothetical protein